MTKYAVPQIESYGNLLPEGYGEVLCLSGWRFGWGDAMTVDRVLGMQPDTLQRGQPGIRDRIRRHVMPLLRGREQVTLIMDLEKPLNPGELKAPEVPLSMDRRIAQAINLRVETLRSEAEASGVALVILIWVGGFSWQERPNHDDYSEVGMLHRLRANGAFDGIDGAAMRIYPQDPPSHQRFDRINRVTNNFTQAMKSVFGEDAFLLPLYPLRTWGGVEYDFSPDEIDAMLGVGVKYAGRAGVWSRKPEPERLPGVSNGNAVTA